MEDLPQNIFSNQGSAFNVRKVQKIKSTSTHNTTCNVALAVTTSDPINFGVYEPEKYFTGRLNELKKFEDFFIQGSNSCVVVSGLGGIGKTQLVRKFIYEKRSMYKNVIWINSESNESIYDSFKAVATRTLDVKTINALCLKDLKPIIEEVLDKLCQSNTLLIYDNVESIESIKFLLPLRPSGKRPNVVITSRIQEFDDGFDVIQLKQWSISEAKEYVSKALEYLNDSNSDIELLAEKLQYFPLALRQGTAYIKYQRRTKDFAISDYIVKCYSQEMLNSNVFQRNATNLYDRTTFTTWSITIETIQREEIYGQLAVRLLNIMAYFTPDNIQRDIFKSLHEEHEHCEVDFEEHVELAVSLLINYSMIDGQDKQRKLTIHRLVQEVIKLKLSETYQDKGILHAALQLIAKKINDAKVYTVQSHAISVFVFALKFAELVAEFKTLPCKILRSTIEIGKYQQAKVFGEIILEPLTIILKQVDMLPIKFEIARAYIVHGYNIEAIQMNNEILETQKTILDEDHPDILKTKFNMAFSYNELGKYAEALQSYIEIFDKQKTIFAEDDSVLLRTKCNIAFTYNNLGNSYMALQLYQEICDKEKTIYEEDHPETLITRSNIAFSYNKLGKYFEALRLYQEILNKRRVILSEDHPAILITESNIAFSYNKLGKYSDALRLYQEIFDKRKAILSVHHPDTGRIRSNIAYLYNKLGKYSEALQLCNEIFNKQKTTLGDDHPDTLRTKFNIALSYHKLGRHSEALQLYQEVSHQRNTKLGENHPDTLRARNSIANSYIELGNYSEALQLNEAVFDKQKTILGYGHPDSLITRSTKAFLYIKLGKYFEALQLCQEILDKQKIILGEDHPDTLRTRFYMAKSYNKLGKYSEERQLYEDIFHRQKTNFDEDHPDTLRTRSNMARSYIKLEKYSEALQIYQEIFDKQKNVFGEDNPYTINTRTNISVLRAKLEKGWLAKLFSF